MHSTFKEIMGIDFIDLYVKMTVLNWVIPEKIPAGVEDIEFPGGIEKRACENSRGQFKKVEFPWVFRKNSRWNLYI